MRNQDRTLGYRAFQVLAFVRDEVSSEGCAPSYSEICTAVGIGSKGEVSRIVGSLERRGLIARAGKGKVRRIRLKQTANHRKAEAVL